MKFGITKFEKFAFTACAVSQPTANMEIGRVRLRAWDALEVASLAESLAMAVSGIPQQVQMAEWADNKKPVLVDLDAAVVAWMLQALEGQKPGPTSDVLTRLHGRISDLQAKKYKLPEELRR